MRSRRSRPGYRLHGGFDAKGTYISPRTLHRWPAVEAWQAQLKQRGLSVIDASTRLLKRGAYPSIQQQELLLNHGLGETLWNALTITGVIEARGRALVRCDGAGLSGDHRRRRIGHMRRAFEQGLALRARAR